MVVGAPTLVSYNPRGRELTAQEPLPCPWHLGRCSSASSRPHTISLPPQLTPVRSLHAAYNRLEETRVRVEQEASSPAYNPQRSRGHRGPKDGDSHLLRSDSWKVPSPTHSSGLGPAPSSRAVLGVGTGGQGASPRGQWWPWQQLQLRLTMHFPPQFPEMLPSQPSLPAGLAATPPSPSPGTLSSHRVRGL